MSVQSKLNTAKFPYKQTSACGTHTNLLVMWHLYRKKNLFPASIHCLKPGNHLQKFNIVVDIQKVHM
jgi:hypothetical protein